MRHRRAIYGLVRGYPGLRKWRYWQLVRRNRALRAHARATGYQGDFLLFHEGNISAIDQEAVTRLSGISLQFIDVSEAFRPDPHHVWTGEARLGLGYSLMCKFNYSDIWKYLDGYDWGCRVDEDVVVKSLPEWENIGLFKTGALSHEAHEPTNETFRAWLEERGWGWAYDHEFPYTNLYMTDLRFWRRPDVRGFLDDVASHEHAIENRWGDLPVLGVALKIFGGWDGRDGVDPVITYYHASHGKLVRRGVIDG